MGWLKLDDQYDLHDKVMGVQPLTELLDLRGMLSCARRESDGYLSPSQLHVVGRGIPVVKRRIGELVVAGRWHAPGHDCEDCPQPRDGWQIHDFLEYNPSKAQREAEREAAKQRMAKARSQNVRPNRQRTSVEVRPTPAPPVVPSEQGARASRGSQGTRAGSQPPAPQPPDYEPTAWVAKPPPAEVKARIAGLKVVPLNESEATA